MPRKRKREKRTPAAASTEAAPPPPPRRSVGPWFWWGVTGVAVVLHVVLLPMSPKLTRYPGDHDDFVRWGIQATDRGLLTMYSEPPPRQQMQVWRKQTGRWYPYERPVDRVCNYPPGSVYLLWISGLAHKVISSDDRLINTVSSRATYLFWSMLCDFLVAWGCAAIVALYKPGWAARVTYALALLLPPLWWDSIIWGQMDSVVLAPSVWMLYFMMRRRWVLAGVLWGVAFGLKTQAVLFIPLWGAAIFLGRPRWGPWVGGVVAFVTLALITLPYNLTGEWSQIDTKLASFWAPAWFHFAYWKNLFEIYAQFTTLKAFNLWYLDLLINDSIYSDQTILGVEKGAWGKRLLALGLLAGLAAVVWRYRRDRRALLFYAILSLLAFMMLPTNVHERYLILLLPFLGAAAGLQRRLLPGLLLLVVAMMAQLTWPHWLPSGRGKYADMEPGQIKNALAEYDRKFAEAARDPRELRRPMPRDEFLELAKRELRASYWRTRAETASREWLFTILSLVGSVVTVALLFTIRPRDDVTAPGVVRPGGG